MIEIDGLSHVGRADEDEQREADLRQTVYNVVRYTNDQVIADVNAVVEDIAKHAGVAL